MAPRLEILTFGLLLYQTNQHEQIRNTSSQSSLKTSPIKDQSRAVELCEDCDGPFFPGHQSEEGSMEECEEEPVKGILPHKNFYRPNLVFWIVMGCGIAGFGRRCQKNTKIGNCLFPGTSRQAAIGAQGAATWDLEASRNDRKRAESQKPSWRPETYLSNL